MTNKNLFLILMILLTSYAANAEPYLAARTGLKCMSCHISPTGGGMRNETGQAFGRSLAESNSGSFFVSNISDNIKIGGDFRGTFQSTDTPNEKNQLNFKTDRASIYLSAQLLENLTFYIDQQQAPASENRAAWIMYQNQDKSLYFRSGKFFIPYGLRLEDDSAFIRQTTGINLATADNGIEIGQDSEHWSNQLSITNGTAGASENNTNKQFSLRSVYIKQKWRLGASINENKSPNITRTMLNIFSTLSLFDSEWLFEIDRITDDSGVKVIKEILFFEINKELYKGHNLKLGFEAEDPNVDIDEDHRIRNSLVWEYFPIPHIQLRTGIRHNKGIPQKPLDNSDEIFLNLHAWF